MSRLRNDGGRRLLFKRRRFQPVKVEEPTESEALDILKGLRPYYERHHGVEITDEALEAAVKMSVRYINDRFLPD